MRTITSVKNRQFEEETKEQRSPPMRSVTEVAKAVVEEEEVQEPSSLEEKQKGLPEQIKQNKYDCEHGYAVWREMPGVEHKTVVILIVKKFSAWKDEQRTPEREVQVEAYPEQDVYVSRSYSQNAKRLPDLGLWGAEPVEGKRDRSRTR
eukprot:scaffold269_cov125-Cylindrotheca_fusiformis.AAC.1